MTKRKAFYFPVRTVRRGVIYGCAVDVDIGEGENILEVFVAKAVSSVIYIIN